MSIDTVKFRGRHNSIKALVALVTGSIALLSIPAMALVVGISRSEAAFWMGVIGIAAFLAAIAGFVVSLLGSRERDIYYAVPIAGMVVNGVTIVAYLIIYIMGALV